MKIVGNRLSEYRDLLGVSQKVQIVYDNKGFTVVRQWLQLQPELVLA
jgi:hypothetical protein